MLLVLISVATGVVSSLIREILDAYPLLSPAALSAETSQRVCAAVSLMQNIASHSETCIPFVQAQIPLLLFPFLNTACKTRPFEYLRLTSLGVVGALVKQNDNTKLIHFLLSTDIIPLSLRIMEQGSELSQTVAIFIVQKILLDDAGLAYVCQSYKRFLAVARKLGSVTQKIVDTKSVRLLKHVVRCYLRLSDNVHFRETLHAHLPRTLRDGTFSQVLKDDHVGTMFISCLSNRGFPSNNSDWWMFADYQEVPRHTLDQLIRRSSQEVTWV